MKSLTKLLTTALICAAITAQAATLSLSDGSTIKGELQKVHKGVFYFKTAFAGVLEIKQDQVMAMESAESVYLRTGSGEVFQGPVMAGEGGEVTVASSSGPVKANVGDLASAWKPMGSVPMMSKKAE